MNFDRIRVQVYELDENGVATSHDLGEVRIRESEVGLLYFDEDGEPFVSVMPECEARGT